MRIITIILCLNTLLSFGQENLSYEEDLYLYINNKNFLGANNEFKAYFSLKSSDERFMSDNYLFNIFDNDIFKDESLYNMGEQIDINTIKYVEPDEFFKGKSNCEIHTDLSLYKSIFIVTEIPKKRLKDEKDLSKTFLYWYVSYIGTVKNITYNGLSHKTVLEKE